MFIFEIDKTYMPKGPLDPRREVDRRNGRQLSEDHTQVANLPQEPIQQIGFRNNWLERFVYRG